MPTEAQQKATNKWRENNPDKYKETSRKSSLKYYYNNREKILNYKKNKYQEKKDIVEEKEEI